jgi:transcription antitermination factor NusG
VWRGIVTDMPILRKESEFFPGDLFSIPVEQAPWQVAHVRSRQEKLLARFLEKHQKPFYLPQIKRTAKRNGRTFTSQLPLFAGYVFVRRVSGMQIIWRSNVVVNLIDVYDQDRLMMELLQVRSLQEKGAVLMPVNEVAVGEMVRITEGVFRGYFGTVMRETAHARLIISVSTLRKAVAVEFPRDVVVRSNPEAAWRGP